MTAGWLVENGSCATEKKKQSGPVTHCLMLTTEAAAVTIEECLFYESKHPRHGLDFFFNGGG